jgi:hypothetical protein
MGLRRVFGSLKAILFVLMIGGVATAVAAERTIYSTVSNKELMSRALRLVTQIRDLTYSHKERDRELMAEHDKKSRPEIRIDQRRVMREQWLRESEALHDKTLRQYREKYWADAILLRDELYRRLPKRFRQPHTAVMYQYPTNVLGVEAIADHLELLARSLPEK